MDCGWACGGSIPCWDLSVGRLDFLFCHVWVFPMDSGFPPQSKNMLQRLIGDSKLSLGYACMIVWLTYLYDPVME